MDHFRKGLLTTARVGVRTALAVCLAKLELNNNL